MQDSRHGTIMHDQLCPDIAVINVRRQYESPSAGEGRCGVCMALALSSWLEAAAGVRPSWTGLITCLLTGLLDKIAGSCSINPTH